MQIDPVFITPRMLPRRWGKTDLGGWCAGAPMPSLAVGEIWLAHPHNVASDGDHFGAHISQAPDAMLGDLGRAPPLVRMIQTDALAGPLFSDSPVAMWRIIEAKPGAGLSAGRMAGPRTKFACKPGDVFLVSEDQALEFSPGIVAIEVRTSFLPSNERGTSAGVIRVPRDGRTGRSTLLRDPALSAELWTLPAESYLRPDGETCHVLVALTDDVKLNGKALRKGMAALLPANGATATITGEGAQVLVAYPDLLPTQIWRHVREAEPHAADAASLADRAMNLTASR